MDKSVIIGSFLNRIREYEFANMYDEERTDIVDEYLMTSVAAFDSMCRTKILDSYDAENGTFDFGMSAVQEREAVKIISLGMVVEWLAGFKNNQDNLELLLNTRDFTTYAPHNIQNAVRNTYESADKEYAKKMREFTFQYGDLTRLHI